MNINLHYGKPESYDYSTLLDQLSGTNVKSIKTSSIPLAEFWKETNNRLSGLINHLNLFPNSNVQLCFEYPTSPKQGKGKASMTDLMVLYGDTKIAIEAKFSEYKKMDDEQIGDWLKENPDNRKKVLSYWDSLIFPFTKGIEENEKMKIDYQFYHRTASACYQSQKAFVIYQLFYDDETLPYLDNFVKKLEGYKSIINPTDMLRYFVWKVKTNLLRSDINKNDAFYLMKTEKVYEFTDSHLVEI